MEASFPSRQPLGPFDGRTQTLRRRNNLRLQSRGRDSGFSVGLIDCFFFLSWEAQAPWDTPSTLSEILMSSLTLTRRRRHWSSSVCDSPGVRAARLFAIETTQLTLISGTGWGSVSLLKKLDTENYNVVVISPRNFFLFTPLLPSCTTGLIEHRSIMEPIRNILRHKKAAVKYYEAHATKIDYERKVVCISDESEIRGDTSRTEVPFDLLVVGVGAENATFG